MGLLKIQIATAETAVIRLHPADNVAIARIALSAGYLVRESGGEIRTTSAIPAGHKVALLEIPAGTLVFRYGAPIGTARSTIQAGEHVHTHNLVLHEPEEGGRVEGLTESPTSARLEQMPIFLGY